MTLQHLRSSTANKRPTPAAMSDGQLAMNTNLASPGLFLKDSNGDLVKVGPVHVGTTAPNATPAVGGQAGNSKGEQWLDTTGGVYVFKIYDGTAWRSETGTFVDVNGDTMTGALGIIAGSAAAPSLFFSGDTNTGIYSPGADQVAVATNGTGRLFIDSSGQVGIGTSSPGASLDVVGNIELGTKGASNNTVFFDITSDTTYTDYGFRLIRGGAANGNTQLISRGTGALELNCVDGGYLGFSTSNNERLRITSAGLVGIGTSSPAAALDIGVTGGMARAGGSSGNNLIQVYSGAGGLGMWAGGTTRFYTTSNMTFSVNSTIGTSIPTGYLDALTITSAGNVGIGTASPSSTLHVVGSQFLTGGNYFTDTTSGYFFNGSGGFAGGIFGSSSGNIANIVSPQTIALSTASSERARIDSSGRLLVGTSSARTAATYGAAGFQVESTYFANSSISAINNQATSDGSALLLGKSRGTSNGSNTIVQAGDTTGYISFQGADGTNLKETAAIFSVVDATPGANDMPGRLVFSTTADGAASPTERLRIKSTGTINVSNVATYADNTAALAGGLVAGDVYRKSDGTLMITY